ncbi:MAG: hypothetical protein JSR72_23730 [Proteobacteria bacterium]|nr:hypothetical protein [Pseudomonadota bacterium]
MKLTIFYFLLSLPLVYSSAAIIEYIQTSDKVDVSAFQTSVAFSHGLPVVSGQTSSLGFLSCKTLHCEAELTPFLGLLLNGTLTSLAVDDGAVPPVLLAFSTLYSNTFLLGAFLGTSGRYPSGSQLFADVGYVNALVGLYCNGVPRIYYQKNFEGLYVASYVPAENRWLVSPINRTIPRLQVLSGLCNPITKLPLLAYAYYQASGIRVLSCGNYSCSNNPSVLLTASIFNTLDVAFITSTSSPVLVAAAAAGNLSLISCASPQCPEDTVKVSTLAISGNVSEVSLAVRGDLSVVAYRDETTNTLNVLACTSTACDDEPFELATAAGYGLDLALAPNSAPMISSYAQAQLNSDSYGVLLWYGTLVQVASYDFNPKCTAQEQCEVAFPSFGEVVTSVYASPLVLRNVLCNGMNLSQVSGLSWSSTAISGVAPQPQALDCEVVLADAYDTIALPFKLIVNGSGVDSVTTTGTPSSCPAPPTGDLNPTYLDCISGVWHYTASLSNQQAINVGSTPFIVQDNYTQSPASTLQIQVHSLAHKL